MILIAVFVAVLGTSTYFIIDHYKESDKQAELYGELADLVNAGVELLECDHVYAEGIKAELERHTFADCMVPFEGDSAEKKQIDETDVRFYLEMRMRIYVREENIMFDAENGLCKIRLNDVLTANIPIKSGTAVRSIEI